MNDTNRNVFIEGKTVNLAPISKENLELHAKWLNDPNIRRYTREVIPETVEKLKKQLEESSKEFPKRNIVFEIYHKKDQKSIGIVSFHQIRWVDRIGMMGILVGEPEYWNKGIGTEACELIFEYGFDELNFYKILAQVLAPNTNSIRLLEKLGMKKEVTQTKHYYVDGEYVDQHLYSIFQADWE